MNSTNVIAMEALERQTDRALEAIIIDSVMRAVDGAGKEYRNDQLQNALNAGRVLKARQFGIETSALNLEDNTNA